MSTSLLSRTLYYKQCKIDDAPAGLSDLLASALSAKANANDRTQPLPGGSDRLRLINEVVRQPQYVFGSIVEWTSGRWQPVISLEPDRPAFTIKDIPPGDKEEFVEGMGYFLAYRNHVVVAKGRQLGSSAIENHLEWLLRDHVQLIPPASFLFLNDAPQPPESRLAKPVNRITLTPGPIREGRKGSSLATESIAMRDDVVRTLIGRLREMRLLRLGEEKIEALLASRNLKASVKLSYTKSRDGDGDQILDVLAQALRHADGEWGFKLNVPGVGEVHGDELTLKHQVFVPHGVAGEPQMDSLAGAMWTWLSSLISGQQVSAEV